MALWECIILTVVIGFTGLVCFGGLIGVVFNKLDERDKRNMRFLKESIDELPKVFTDMAKEMAETTKLEESEMNKKERAGREFTEEFLKDDLTTEAGRIKKKMKETEIGSDEYLKLQKALSNLSRIVEGEHIY